MIPIRTYAILTYYREERIAITTLPCSSGRSYLVLPARSLSGPRNSVGSRRLLSAAHSLLRRCAPGWRVAALGSLYLLRPAARREYSSWCVLSAGRASRVDRQHLGA